MDSAAVAERDWTWSLQHVDEGGTEMSSQGGRRALLPSERGCIVARYVSLTFPEPGKIILKVGPGDHSVQTFELEESALRMIVLDALPKLLR
jgi:hypothetical protein